MASGKKYCEACCCDTDRYKDGRCVPCRHKINARWEKNNRDLVNAKSRKWNAANADVKRSINAAYRANNKDKINARRRQKRLEDPSAEKNKTAKRRKATGKLPKGIIKNLLAKQNNRCACCGVVFEGLYHLDHIVPISRGGKNTEDNVQLLLPKCNLQKYTMTFEEFLSTRRNKQLTQVETGVP